MTTKQYQKYIHPLVAAKFQNLEVKSEWTTFGGYRNHYSPRVDIAVGPFSIYPGYTQMEEYNILVREHFRPLLNRLYDFHVQNIGDEAITNEVTIPEFEMLITKNQNARCFLAIEIEKENSKKHIMGSLINAAPLGRVGIGIAYNEKTVRTFMRILNYLAFLKRVRKNTYDTTNFLILTKDQMTTILN